MLQRFFSVVALAALASGCGDDTNGGGAGAGGSADGGQAQGGTGGVGGSGGAAEPPAPDPIGFDYAGSLNKARSHHTATLLQDGRVLIIGGDDADANMLDAVEVYSPEDDMWTALTPLPEPRSNHTATLLEDGRVLVTGGGTTSAIGLPNGVLALDTAVVFDPVGDSYEDVGLMSDKRADHRAIRLDDGRVLVMGGSTDQISEDCTVIPNCTVGQALDTAEIFDPTSGEFTATGPLIGARYSAVSAMLHDGRPIIAGGVDSNTSVNTAEIYDPGAGTFTATSDMQYDRLFATGALLGSGKFLIAGGKKADVAPQAFTEVYDPDAGAWTKVGDLVQPRTGAQAVTLETGRVLHIGGYDQIVNAVVKVVEVFDEATNEWSEIGTLKRARSLHTATVLADGRVLVCGGSGGFSVEPTCELSFSE